MTTTTPFALLDLKEVEMTERGYLPYPDKIIYDPVQQVTNLLNMGGKTEPTTTSQCADTTGVWPISPSDSDESNDDTGTD
jgi:hypothetical protein